MSPKAKQLVVAGLAAVLPILGAAFAAYLQSLHDQQHRATILADEAERRASRTSEQLLAGFNALSGVAPDQACSQANIMQMRRIALSSPYLAGLGFMSNDALDCSSFGDQAQPLDIGAPDYVSVNGYGIRQDRELEIAPGTRLVLLTAPSGFVGFYNPSLVLTVAGDEDDVSVGIVSASTRQPEMSAGVVQFDWKSYPLSAPGQSAVSTIGNQIVATNRAVTWDQFAYTAIPFAAVTAEFPGQLALYLPFGLLGALGAFFGTRRFVRSRTSILAFLKQAIQRREITVEFQPIVDMQTGRWLGAEALARWRMSGGEQVPADVFIRLAEENGLITEVTKLILATGMREMAPVMRSDTNSFFVTFNLATADLEDASLIPRVAALIREHSLQRSNVHLEITERQSVESEAQIGAVSDLRSMGIQVGTDDFEIGCSNLSYLTSVPLDYIKIDRSLVANSVRDNAAYDIVDTIVQLAGARGIELIAEGVETEAKRSHLLEHGVRLGQGWLFGRSMPAAKFVVEMQAAAARMRPGNPVVPAEKTQLVAVA